MKSNSHFKIYLSIRQEAYIAQNTKNANAIVGAVSIIKYTDVELRALLLYLLQYYEKNKYNALRQFIKLDYFYNRVTKSNEKIFDYMNRYSFSWPRDFVSFCSELSPTVGDEFGNDEERRVKLKEIISEISSIISSTSFGVTTRFLSSAPCASSISICFFSLSRFLSMP